MVFNCVKTYQEVFGGPNFFRIHLIFSNSWAKSTPDWEARLTRRGDKIQRQNDKEKVLVVKNRNPKILLQSHFKKEPTLLGPWKNSKTGKIEKNTTMIGFPVTAPLFIKPPTCLSTPRGGEQIDRWGLDFVLIRRSKHIPFTQTHSQDGKMSRIDCLY